MTKAFYKLLLKSILLLVLAPMKSWALLPDDCSNNVVTSTTPSSDFAAIDGGVIISHLTTGLEWQRCTIGKTWDGTNCSGTASKFTWEEALVFAEGAGLGWRLPNINELLSIVEQCRTWPAINRSVFPNANSNSNWSASPSAQDANRAWFISFRFGYVNTLPVSTPLEIRLVRKTE